jgi:hypothetical protein
MSALSETISKYVPIVRKPPKLDKSEALAVVPMRHPMVEWERKGEEVFLDVPMRDDRVARLIKKFMKNMPDKRQIALDSVGSDVWELCDGQRNISSVVVAVAKNHKLTRREAEVSVTMFLQTLAKKNLIGLMSAGGKRVAKRNR